MAVAPASTSLSMNWCPSAATPFTATNTQPLFTLLESICMSFTSTPVLPTTDLMLTLYNMSINLMMRLRLTGKLKYHCTTFCKAGTGCDGLGHDLSFSLHVYFYAHVFQQIQSIF